MSKFVNLGFGLDGMSGSGIVNIRMDADAKGRPYPVYVDRNGAVIPAWDPRTRLDAGETVFLANQLEVMETAIVEVKRPELDGAMLCPIVTDVPSWALRHSWRTRKESGKAGFMGSGSDGDIPLVAEGITKNEGPLERFGLGFEYDVDEISAAQANGVTLEPDGARMVARGIDEFIDSGIFNGYPDKNLPGFFDDPLVPKELVAGGTAFVDSTAETIRALINSTISDVVTATNGVEKPNRVAMAQSAFDYINETPWSTSNDTTILQHVETNNRYLSAGSIVPMVGLNSVNMGPGFTTQAVMVAYTPDPANVQIKVVPMSALPVQERLLKRLFIWTAKLGGVHWKFPLSAKVVHGI